MNRFAVRAWYPRPEGRGFTSQKDKKSNPEWFVTDQDIQSAPLSQEAFLKCKKELVDSQENIDKLLSEIQYVLIKDRKIIRQAMCLSLISAVVSCFIYFRHF